MRGGKRPGAGRPKGAASKLDAEARAAALSSPDETPLDFLLRIMRDANQPLNERKDAAKAAAPYVHARLSTVDVGNKDDKPFEQVMRWASSPDEATPDPSKQ